MPRAQELAAKTGRRKARCWLNHGPKLRLVPLVFALHQSLHEMIYEKCEGDAQRDQKEKGAA